MADVLKAAGETPDAGDARVRRVASAMLLRIELGGDRVVREYSRALDGWDPPELHVGADEIERASAGARTRLGSPPLDARDSALPACVIDRPSKGRNRS